MDEHSAHIVTGVGWGNAVPIVVRVHADGRPGEPGPVVLEASLGLSWGGPTGPFRAWMELGRRADVALAAHGFTRTADWEPHVYPRPIAEAKVSLVAANQ